MRHLRPSDGVTTPWKNGGGTTTQIAVAPEGAGLVDRFLWRVSLAHVASDGPFSIFAGYDRHLVVVEGEGMRLALPDGERTLAPLVPVSFSGDDPSHGTLVRGPVRDFNLMVDRARASGSLACPEISTPTRFEVAPGETCILHVLQGSLETAGEGDTLVAEAPFDVTPRTPTRLVVARVTCVDGDGSVGVRAAAKS